MRPKRKCVECRHCEVRVHPKDGTRDYCRLTKRLLPRDVCARPACRRFQPQDPPKDWGP